MVINSCSYCTWNALSIVGEGRRNRFFEPGLTSAESLTSPSPSLGLEGSGLARHTHSVASGGPSSRLGSPFGASLREEARRLTKRGLVLVVCKAVFASRVGFLIHVRKAGGTSIVGTGACAASRGVGASATVHTLDNNQHEGVIEQLQDKGGAELSTFHTYLS